MSATCGSLSQFFQPLIDQGLTGKDTYLIQYLKDVNDPAYADDPIVKQFHEVVPRRRASTTSRRRTPPAGGWRWYIEEILQAGGHLRGRARPRQHHAGGPQHRRARTRSCSRGIKNDHRRRLRRLPQRGRPDGRSTQITDPTQLGTFVPDGEVIDLNGSNGNFSDLSGG